MTFTISFYYKNWKIKRRRIYADFKSVKKMQKKFKSYKQAYCSWWTWVKVETAYFHHYFVVCIFDNFFNGLNHPVIPFWFSLFWKVLLVLRQPFKLNAAEKKTAKKTKKQFCNCVLELNFEPIGWSGFFLFFKKSNSLPSNGMVRHQKCSQNGTATKRSITQRLCHLA